MKTLNDVFDLKKRAFFIEGNSSISTHRNLLYEFLGYLAFSPYGLMEEDLKLLLGEWQQWEADGNINDFQLSHYHFSNLTKALQPFLSGKDHHWILNSLSLNNSAINKYFTEHKQKQTIMSNLETFQQKKERFDTLCFCNQNKAAYVKRKHHIDVLNNHMNTPSSIPIVITGNAGSGKTTLLANWYLEHANENPNIKCVCHFPDVPSSSLSIKDMIKKITSEICSTYNITWKCPELHSELFPAFIDFLWSLPDNHTIQIIIDDVDRLTNTQHALEMKWLPYTFPEHIQVILSLSSGIGVSEIKKRGWKVLDLELFSSDESIELIEKLSQHFEFNLTNIMKTHIISANQISDPFFLTTLIHRLMLHNDHTHIHNMMNKYLESEHIIHLFETIMSELSEQHNSKWLEFTMCFLRYSENGLKKHELKQLVEKATNRDLTDLWESLFTSIETFLKEKNGIYRIFSNRFSAAITRRFVPHDNTINAIYSKLIEFWESTPITLRHIENLSLLYAKTGKWDTLFDFINHNLWKGSLFVEKQWALDLWNLLKTHHSFSEKECVSPMDNIPLKKQKIEIGQYYKILSLIYEKVFAEEFNQKDSYEVAAHFLQSIRSSGFRLWEHDNSEKEYAILMLKESELYFKQGNYGKSETLCDDAVKRLFWSDKSLYLKALHMKTNILRAQGDSTNALNELRRLEEKCRFHNFTDQRLIVLEDLCDLHLKLNLIQEAEYYFKEHLTICRETGNHAKSLFSLKHLGRFHKDKEGHKKALPYYIEHENICRKLGLLKELQISLFFKVDMLEKKGHLRRALEINKEQQEIAEHTHDDISLSVILHKQQDLIMKIATQEENPSQSH